MENLTVKKNKKKVFIKFHAAVAIQHTPFIQQTFQKKHCFKKIYFCVFYKKIVNFKKIN